MRFLTLSIATLATIVLAEDVVKIEITRAVECERKSQKGDRIEVHYRGTLESGKEFDASYNRGSPLEFIVGEGQVIRGWDENLMDMCIGEKRILTIPPAFAYGDRGAGPIPPGSTLIFETELIGIAGVPKPEKIIEKTPASSEEPAAAEEVKEPVTTKAAEAAAESGSDGQEHSEL